MSNMAAVKLLAALLVLSVHTGTSHATRATPAVSGRARELLQQGMCECMKKQLAGNCGAVCPCLEAANIGIPPGGCLVVCQ
jgi:hypothetical protein